MRPTDSVGAGDPVCRTGGDEFLLMLANAGDRAGVAGDRILSALHPACHIKGQELFARPSIGISLCPDDGETAEALVAHADEAMNVAKGRGVGRCEFFDSGMATAQPDCRSLENNECAFGHIG